MLVQAAQVVDEEASTGLEVVDHGAQAEDETGSTGLEEVVDHGAQV